MDWFDRAPLLAIDCETTGPDPTRDRAVSWAAVECRPGAEPRDAVPDPLVCHPGADALPVPDEAAAIHGITTGRAESSEVGEGQAALLVAGAIARALRAGAMVVGGNVRFDLTVLDRALRRNGHGSLTGWLSGRGAVLRVADPMVLDRWADRYRDESRAMRCLCARYGVVNPSPHDARSDAVAAAELVRVVVRTAVAVPSGGWRGDRGGELAGCSGPDDLHALHVRWHASWCGASERTRPVEPGWPVFPVGVCA